MACGYLLSHGRAALAALLLATAAASVASSPPREAPVSGPAGAIDPALAVDAVDVPVVVQARPGRTGQVADAAARAGAHLGAPLPLVDGFAARVSGPAVAALATSPDVVAVTLDRAGAFQSSGARRTAATESAYVRATGAPGAWDLGYKGTGVTVAVLDTGISPMPDLADRTVHGPDLSGEGTLIDSYGHGTVMAGIIAGSGDDSQGRRTGVAPEAGLVAVKVAGRNGAVDVSTVLQGMAWVAAHRQELGIRVLNLAYAPPPPRIPPSTR